MGRVVRLIARALDAVSFAPFGTVSRRAVATDRTAIVGVGDAENRRGGAIPRLGWFSVPASAWPVTARQMERHCFSSQHFIPCGSADWLVLVAPHAASGPDMARAVAFLARAEDAVTLRPNTWHHPLTALAAQDFAVLTFLAGDAEDEQFVDLPEPVTIVPA